MIVGVEGDIHVLCVYSVHAHELARTIVLQTATNASANGVSAPDEGTPPYLHVHMSVTFSIKKIE